MNDEFDRFSLLEQTVDELKEQNNDLSTKLSTLANLIDAVLNNRHVGGTTQQPQQLPALGATVPVVNPTTTPAAQQHSDTLRPSPPLDFDGERSKGRAFLNSCELYMALVPSRFPSDELRIRWVYSFMKSGRAALFVDRVFRQEAKTGVQAFGSWSDFRNKFLSEFCPQNETQLALAKLETSSYHQGKRTVEEYIDHFRDLIDRAGYVEGLAIVIKFRRGLHRDVQDAIATLPTGRPGDADPEAWFEAAMRYDENRRANATFQSGHKTPSTLPAFSTFPSRLVPTTQNAFRPTPTLSATFPSVSRGEPMQVDAAKRQGPSPIVCYRCGKPGHVKTECPQRFDIRFMSVDEREGWENECALQRDCKELSEQEEIREEEKAEDFSSRNE